MQSQHKNVCITMVLVELVILASERLIFLAIHTKVFPVRLIYTDGMLGQLSLSLTVTLVLNSTLQQHQA